MDSQNRESDQIGISGYLLRAFMFYFWRYLGRFLLHIMESNREVKQYKVD
jgi:hypothetical protein